MNLASLEDLDIEIRPQVKLEHYTTFRLGGPCQTLIHCQTPEQLTRVVGQLAQQKIEFILIGGGSNLVVSDSGVDCVVIRYVSTKRIIERENNDLLVSGSTYLDDLAYFAVCEGMDGMNCTTGIPGTVGGAIVGNAGAFGKQVGDILRSVTLLSRQGKIIQVEPSQLEFTYRNSNLKQTGHIVLSARFALKPGDGDALEKERNEILATRREKHPNLQTHPCAGSFFRNIEPTSKAEKRQASGWFLEQAGAKNLKVGGAFIFEKHANIIVKGKDCTAQDVYDLHLQMKKLVKEKFNLDLMREVRFVGEFSGKVRNRKEIIW